jgi:pimeloyl-ACP methyl ester carboxylesterase
VTGPGDLFVALDAGQFHTLVWDGGAESAVFLHGLTGTADVWGLTIEALGQARPTSWAYDQRGHGQSPAPPFAYAVAAFVGDLVEFVGVTRLPRPHLVGHSLGGRVAMVAAARRPALFRSVSVVDIGPEKWAANIRETFAGIDQMPATFSREEALMFFTRGRPVSAELEAVYLSRFEEGDGGMLRWRGEPQAWKAAVRSHRSRDFWREWSNVRIPALLVRGGASKELRPQVAAEMRRRNPSVRFEELPGVGHNIPLLAPGALADRLRAFWEAVPGAGT